jgi:acetyltransferase-like isoleucine patch superfamily enzyme
MGPVAWPAVPSAVASLRARGLAALSGVAHGAWEVASHRLRITADHPRARRFASMGDGSWIAFPPGDHLNTHAVSIGRDCGVSAHTSLLVGMPTERWTRTGEPVIRIGDRAVIGRGCWFVGRDRIVVEDDVTFAPHVYVTDHNHTYADPWLPVGQQILQSDPVRIGSGTWIGTNVVVLPGAHIGRNCAIAAGSVVRGHVPDHSVVAGVPAQVVRRWTEAEGWQPPLSRPVPVVEGWPVGVPPDGPA